MEGELAPCPRCQRHAPVGAPCPFCRRKGRIVLVTALAVAVAGAAVVTAAYTTLYGGAPQPVKPPETPGEKP